MLILNNIVNVHMSVDAVHYYTSGTWHHDDDDDNNNNNNNGYSALGPVWQGPEPSQATGMALIRCILGKFLGECAIALPRV